MHDFWFFLSYARIDKIGPYLRRFHKDLSEEIRRRVPLPTSTSIQQIGFFDETIEVGEKWPDSIAAALLSTRTLVCLYSRGYFASPYCGKEFEVFRQRIEGISGASFLIMPVLWSAPKDLPSLPSAVAQSQYAHSAFGDVYAEQGLYRIMVQKRYHDHYKQFILEFADQLETHARKFTARSLEKLPPLSQTPNPFEMSQSEAGNSMRRAKSKGPFKVQFYFLAGNKVDMAPIKNEIGAYGEEGGHDWRPFYPKVEKSAGLISQHEATQAGLISEMCRIETDLIDQLAKAEKENTIVFLLIDPWTVRLEFYRRRLHEYDEKRLINCGALVIWNEHDREVRFHSDVLKDDLYAALSRQIVSGDSSFRESIISVESLSKEIGETIIEIQRKLMRRANILRPISGTGAKPPSISGSWRHFDG